MRMRFSSGSNCDGIVVDLCHFQTDESNNTRTVSNFSKFELALNHMDRSVD